MNLVRAMATVGGLTGVSRIAGFLRDVLTASILGAGPIADAFFVALRLPNFFRRVSAEGAFSVSFVPVYADLLANEGQDKADRFASDTFMVMTATLSAFCVAAMIGMPYVLYVVAPGFQDDPIRFDLAVELSRITFPYLLAMSLVSLLGGVLNAHHKFAPFAFAPVLFNLCQVVALLMVGYFHTAGHALSWGIAAAGVLQLAWLYVAAVRGGFRLHIGWPRLTPEVKKVFALMGPGVIGAGVVHINLFADMVIGSFLETGSISYLYYADRLNQLPLGILGIAVGTALLPMLSQSVSNGNREQSNDLFNRALEYCCILALPAAVALGVFSELIIGGLFERGAFTAQDTIATAQVLTFYVAGLPAYIAIKIFSTVHWAQQNTTTPVKIAVIGTVANILMALALILPLGVGGIALATALSSWLQIALHWRELRRQREHFNFDDAFIRCFFKVVLATIAMVAAAFALDFVLAYVDAPRLVRLVGVVGVGGGVYGSCALVMGIVKIADLKKLFVRKKA